MFIVNVEASWCGLKEGCSSGLYLTTKAKSNWACKHTDRKESCKHSQRNCSSGLWRRVCERPPHSSCSTKKSVSSVPGPAFSSRDGAEKQREKCRSPASSCPVASVTCQLLAIYLVVNVFAVESYVNSECGGVMVRDEQRLLIRFVPHHKVQGGGTLIREDMLVSSRAHRQQQLQHWKPRECCNWWLPVYTSNYTLFS